jgi:Mg-chelatase subunit ChlD
MRISYPRILPCLTILSLWGCVAPSQEAPCTSRTLPVSFRDGQNLPIQTISPDDLRATVRGKSIKILSITPDVRPHRLVLLLDTSGSMASPSGSASTTPWILELSLAHHFYETNRQTSQIALLLFSDKNNEVIDFPQGNSAVGNELQHLAEDREYAKAHVKGKTALLEAIFQGIQLLDHPSSADAIFVLTDGEDNASHLSAAELNRRVAQSSVRIFGIIIRHLPGYQSRTPEMVPAAWEELSEIAQKSGGEILTTVELRSSGIVLSAGRNGQSSGQETLTRLYHTVLQDSLLEVDLPFPIAKSEPWELTLSDAARGRWKDARITYPSTLSSCADEGSGAGSN